VSGADEPVRAALERIRMPEVRAYPRFAAPAKRRRAEPLIAPIPDPRSLIPNL